MRLSDDDHERIALAVAAAERGTSGEIRCVLARGRDPWKLAMIAAACALVLPGLAMIGGWRPDSLLAGAGGWAAIDPTAAQALTGFVIAQAAVFAIALAIGYSPLARLLTPASATRRAAELQFEALGLTHTRDRTGVLLYVNLAHRRAHVLADSGIYDKAPAQAWDEVIALLIAGLKRGSAAQGFVNGVTRTGEILAAHLPPRSDDRNELPDRLTEAR